MVACLMMSNKPHRNNIGATLERTTATGVNSHATLPPMKYTIMLS
jgi:hypothetical protein